MTLYQPSRRALLTWLSGAGLALAATACARDSSRSSSGAATADPPTTSPTASPPTTAVVPSTTVPPTTTVAPISCVLSPEMTEGPYYIDGETIRSDITEGKPGLPLRLVLTVADATTCTPISGATVDVWHADATGNYSGFGSTTSNRTFLRGVQVTDANGVATFQTIYPGWYQGRAVHVHLKVHVGGSVVHTGQLFFDEQVTDAVYAKTPYSSHTGQRTANGQDSIYRSGGAQSLVVLTPASDGYTGAITLGVKRS
jgi:protocatechuate 3,4-dioxygenase beta subunit